MTHRHRRIVAGLAAVTVLLVAAGAFAADPATMRAADAGVSPGFCPAVRALVDAAASGFTSLRGAARADSENTWEGTKRLPSGGACVIFGGKPPAYVCTLYSGDVEENADGAYDRAKSGLKSCLPPGWKTSEQVDGTHTQTTTASGAGGPSVRLVSRDVSADAYLVELWVDGVAPPR